MLNIVGSERRDNQSRSSSKAGASVKKDDGPTLLDLMHEESNAAKARIKAEKEKERAKAADASFGDDLASNIRRGVAAERKSAAEILTTLVAFKAQGNDAVKSKNFSEAERLYTDAIKVLKSAKGKRANYNEGHILYSNRSLARAKLDKYDDALVDADECIKLAPKWAKGYVRRATALASLGRRDGAQKSFEKALMVCADDNKETRRVSSAFKSTLPEIWKARKDEVFIKGTNNKDAGMVLPEVQKAMADAAPKLQKAASEWANDDLKKRIMDHPTLSKAMADPNFAATMQKMQNDPAAAQKMMEKDPGMRAVVLEFMKLMGNHFTDLGEKQEAAASAAAPPPKPLIQTAEEAELQQRADSVLKNDKVREILSDPETQGVLQQCGQPGALAQFMRHPKWGPRLKVLSDFGLVRFEG